MPSPLASRGREPDQDDQAGHREMSHVGRAKRVHCQPFRANRFRLAPTNPYALEYRGRNDLVDTCKKTRKSRILWTTQPRVSEK
ncbi:hypothetical protein LP7551_00437 [Roseibium album]|nr:hypothetical protein LP7551_00437 [Roseibium album]